MSSEKHMEPPGPTPRKQEEEVLHAPKGRNKTWFLLAFLLAILVLTTFTVPEEVVGCFTGKAGRGSTYMSWNHPHLGPQSITQAHFQHEMQSLDRVWDFVAGQRGRDRRKDKEVDDTAQYIVMSALAE